MKPQFSQLNSDWNAEPNAPEPHVEIIGDDITLSFYVNPFRFKDFEEDEIGFLRFVNCTRFRLGSTNDEGWYMGQCRFSQIAPKWGEFYRISGDPTSTDGPADWRAVSTTLGHERNHFLFYFRDDTFECVAECCIIEPRPDNALQRTGKRLPGFIAGK